MNSFKDNTDEEALGQAYEAMQEHLRLAREYSSFPVNAATLEENRAISERKAWIVKRIEELRAIEKKWHDAAFEE